MTAAEWQAAPARTAMKTAGIALGERRFFTQMIRVADLIVVPAVDDAIARQYSEGCFATWDTTLDGLVTTVTGSARPVDKTGLADDDLAVIMDVRPDGRGVIVRHVEGAENAPPSSEALELRDVDTDLPKIELGPEWGDEAGITVPVIRSKLHGHRGIRSFDPARVEFVSLPPSYYEHPVSCATAAQAAGIRSAFSNAACLRDPSDPRTIAFTILPTHGLVTVERWAPGKAPFGELLDAMDAGQLEVEDRVPQGWHTYEPATSEHRHELVDPTANLADDPLAGLGEPVRPGGPRRPPPDVSARVAARARAASLLDLPAVPVGILDPPEQPAVLLDRRARPRGRPPHRARDAPRAGSSTTNAIRTVLPPSDSGLMLPCSGDSSDTQKMASPDRELCDDRGLLVRAADPEVHRPPRTPRRTRRPPRARAAPRAAARSASLAARTGRRRPPAASSARRGRPARSA